jgi:hypothetical protein
MRRSLAPSRLNTTESSLKVTPKEKQLVNSNEKSEKSDFVKFTVLYGKLQTRKHKVFSDDGFLEVRGKKVVLKDEDGKVFIL